MIYVERLIGLVGGKTTTDDIQQALGAPGRPVKKYQFLTMSASPHARDNDESQQVGTFVANRHHHFGMYKLTICCRRSVAREVLALAVSAGSVV
jgi:hypothetical protein